MPRLFGFEPVALPGPRVAPLVGTPLQLYRFLDDPVGVILSLRRYGDVVGVIGGSPALVAVFGADNIKEVLSNPARFPNDEAVFTGPPGSELDKFRNALIAVNGDVHRRHRRLMQPAFQRAALDGYAAELTRVAAAMLDRWPTGAGVRVDTLTRELALCVAVRCFYGMDVLGGATELGHLAAELVETLTSPFTILTPFNVPGLPYHRAVTLADTLMRRLADLVEAKRQRGPGERDALSLLVHSEVDGQRLSADELLAEALTLFVAGHETIAMTMAWTLFLLERHPDELARVLDEIEATVGESPPTPADLARMPVMDRVIQESMRVLSSVPTLFFRVCGEDTTVGGVRLPAGANLVVSPLAQHHDERLYPEPRRFRPDRWIDLNPGPYGYLPFGAGPRTCVGATFAQQALRILTPMILRRYRFQLASGAEVSRLTRANILLFRHGLTMDVEPFDRQARPLRPLRGDVTDLVDLSRA
ncbi:MAG TPA: cytochrome P450 [Gemmatimonadales bacterium]|nr:cytochrome P450 [Gemmatimonadales bacterium]